MSTLLVPPLAGDDDWPSLGAEVAAWMEDGLAFGPGDLLGSPYRVDAEFRAILERLYQVVPPDHAGPCRFEGWRCVRGSGGCGRRRFDIGVIMTRKGSCKSERAGAIAAVELAADGPVRCDGFTRRDSTWRPVGRPVTSPFIPIFAFAREQAEDTAWDSLSAMIAAGPAAARFAVWGERITRLDGDGEARPFASAPDSRDGARTTWQVKEESHRWDSARHRAAHITTVGNLSKRPIAEPWELHVTTMFAPGAGSVAETLHDAALRLVADPVLARRSRMFFFARWADERIRIRDEAGELDPVALREAVIDASGPVIAAWSDPGRIVDQQFLAPAADIDYAERVWLGRRRRLAERAFDAVAFAALSRPDYVIPPGATVVVGFDGSRGTTRPDHRPDHTGLVVVEVASAHLVVAGHWDPSVTGGMVPRDEVDMTMDAIMATYDVVRVYADPPGWDSEIATWKARYGAWRVIEWYTWRERPMGAACAAFESAIASASMSHDGHPALVAHVGNAHRRRLAVRDERGERAWTVAKERPDSEHKIDLAVCAILGLEARNDAIAAGALIAPPEFVSVYETRGLLWLDEVTDAAPAL